MSGPEPAKPGGTEACEEDDPAASNRTAIYGQLCESYRAIDDFRTKLLGFLPFATGAGVFLLLGDAAKRTSEATVFFAPIGLFGFVITAGLYAFELFGIKKCHFLIETGKHLENELNVVGQFVTRPDPVWGKVYEPFAAAVIYPAVLAAWAFLALEFTCWSQAAWIVAIVVFVVGFLSSLRYGLQLEENSKDELTKKLGHPPSSSAPPWVKGVSS